MNGGNVFGVIWHMARAKACVFLHEIVHKNANFAVYNCFLCIMVMKIQRRV